MSSRKLESKLIRRRMQGATEEDIDEATRRWFAFLQLVDALVAERTEHRRDSRAEPSYVTFDDIAQLDK